MAGASEGARQKQVQVVVRSSAFDLAKEWVQKMNGGADFDPDKDEDGNAGEQETRPSRLGLGAKFVPHSNAVSTSAVAKRLKRQIDRSSKRGHEDKDAKSEEDDDDDDQEESRTSAFSGNKKSKLNA